MEYLIGVGVAAAVYVFAMVSGFDRERVFYPTVLVVVGHYYILFAAMGSSTPVLALESLAATAFVALAVIGFKKSLWLTAAALAGHGIFDFFHHRLIPESRRPAMVARLLHVLRRCRRRSSCRAIDATLRIRVANQALHAARIGADCRRAVFTFQGSSKPSELSARCS